MARFVHVVGIPGSGKSELILALAERYERGGWRCAGQDPDIFTSREEAERERSGADVYFIEYRHADDVRARPGEKVITVTWSAEGGHAA